MKHIILILEIFFCIGSYSALYFFKTGSFIIQGEYLIVFAGYVFFRLLFSVYYKKYKSVVSTSFRSYYRSLFISSAFTLFFLVLSVSLIDLKAISRLFLIGIIVIPSILELLVVGFLFWLRPFKGKLRNNTGKIKDEKEKTPLRLKWVVVGFALLLAAFFLMIKIEYGVFNYHPRSENSFLILFGCWIVTIWLTGKYKYFPSQNPYYHMAPIIKSGFIMFFIIGIIYFFFRLENLSRLVLFGTIPVYKIMEILIFTIIFMGNQKKSVSILKENISNNGDGDIFGQNPLSINPQIDMKFEPINIRELFERVSLEGSDDIVKFLLESINCNLEKNSATLLSTTSIENIKVLPDKSQNLLMNLHLLNDVRRLNEYMIACSNKIKPGGILFGCFVPLARDRQRMRLKMPRIMFNIIYPLHFIFYRIFPKLPMIRHLYFVLTNGRARVISKAEILGRLSYCGYRVNAEKMINNTLYFIAQKLSSVSTEKEPSYSPIVRLKRIGLYGNIMTIFKFRTMHPFSEFIQKDIFKNNSIDSSGKIKEDFRLTNWGNIFRKLWIDELPQLYNWIRGDINLVGVRALSEHYFSLYPKDLQELRTKFKPGMIPPYYADMPKEFDEILESERRYLQRKQEKQYSTDFIYFWKAFVNIVFKGARSR